MGMYSQMIGNTHSFKPKKLTEALHANIWKGVFVNGDKEEKDHVERKANRFDFSGERNPPK